MQPSPTPVLQQIKLIQSFGEMINPYSDRFEIEFEGTDTQRESYIQCWKWDKDSFHHLTGANALRANTTSAWAKATLPRLIQELQPADLASVAVWAAGTYQHDLLKGLLSLRPDLRHTADAKGDCPAHAAAFAQNGTGLAWLFQTDPRAALPPLTAEGQTPLECVLLAREQHLTRRWPVRWGQGNVRECVRTIHEAAPEVLHLPLPGGNTALHVAAGTWRPRLVCQDLVGLGLKWNQPNDDGVTPADVLERNTMFRPSAERPKERRDARFVTESLEAGRVPFKPPGIIKRAWGRLGF